MDRPAHKPDQSLTSHFCRRSCTALRSRKHRSVIFGQCFENYEMKQHFSRLWQTVRCFLHLLGRLLHLLPQ